MKLRHLGLWSAFVSCAALSACGDDEKSQADTTPDATTQDVDTTPQEEVDTTPSEEVDTSTPEEVDVTPTETDITPSPGNGQVEALVPEARSLVLPFDSTLSPDGTEVYYVAMLGSGSAQGHQVFKSVAGEETQLTTDAGLLVPMGIITDGNQIYVLDAGYLPAGGDGTAREGAIVSVPLAGGGVSVVTGTQGYAPINGDVSGNTIVFSGRDPADGVAGVFTVGGTSGTPTAITKGAPLVSPSGVVKTADGVVYVSDPMGDSGKGGIFKVTGSTATLMLGGLHLGTPAGIALSPDQKFLLVSALDANVTSVVLRIDLATGLVTDTYQPDNIKTNQESGGLHCARDVAECVWADLTAGGDGTGIVYRVKLK